MVGVAVAWEDPVSALELLIIGGLVVLLLLFIAASWWLMCEVRRLNAENTKLAEQLDIWIGIARGKVVTYDHTDPAAHLGLLD